ncbi:MAG: GNAT family N-acetyltransferase [Bacteroidia bacterium]|nr:GNAT family N-acetyltransferase [Bacteroidia bacterium]
MKTPPYRIETPRMILRCPRPDEARLLKSAIDSSIEHLKPFMPWAHHEPTELSVKVERIRAFRAEFDSDQGYWYAWFNKEETEIMGTIALVKRVGYGGCEIGYWTQANHVRKGLALEAATALVKVGFEISELDRIEIHYQPENEASSGIPRKLGFTHEATLRRRPLGMGDALGDKCITTLFKEEYQPEKFRNAIVAAWDAGGQKIIF